jgi:hypothetical protein
MLETQAFNATAVCGELKVITIGTFELAVDTSGAVAATELNQIPPVADKEYPALETGVPAKPGEAPV